MLIVFSQSVIRTGMTKAATSCQVDSHEFLFDSNALNALNESLIIVSYSSKRTINLPLYSGKVDPNI